MSSHISGLLAASRVVSRAPVPNETPASPRSASALARADATAWGRWLVQASCRSCAAASIRTGCGLEHFAPEPHHRAGPAGRRRPGQLADVDDAAPEAVGPRRGESRVVGPRQRMAAGEPVRPSPLREARARPAL